MDFDESLHYTPNDFTPMDEAEWNRLERLAEEYGAEDRGLDIKFNKYMVIVDSDYDLTDDQIDHLVDLYMEAYNGSK